MREHLLTLSMLIALLATAQAVGAPLMAGAPNAMRASVGAGASAVDVSIPIAMPSCVQEFLQGNGHAITGVDELVAEWQPRVAGDAVIRLIETAAGITPSPAVA